MSAGSGRSVRLSVKLTSLFFRIVTIASFASGIFVSPFNTNLSPEDFRSASKIPSRRSGTQTIPMESISFLNK